MRTAISALISAAFIFATMPSSADYGLHNYSFGSGGTSNSSSTDYQLNATTGETSNVASSSTDYSAKSGENNTQQANVPAAPSFSNPSNYYDRLLFTINPGSSPSDTKYAVAISNDGFTTTNYIQADDTIGSTKVYQTYTGWGGSSGQLVLGLTYSTTYSIKVSAKQGNFTESQLGPSASASTDSPSITFNMYTDTEPSPPFSTSFGSLLPATVTNSADKLWINLTTNADSGAYVYINSANAGLHSASASSTIASASANLSSASSGYGAQGVSVSQTSGGPLSIVTAYNTTAQSVGALTSNLQSIFHSSDPITGGVGDLILKAKASAQTPEANDYTDTLSFTVAGSF